MKLWVQKSTGNLSPIQLEKIPFASGGEGGLYDIISPSDYQGMVAKVYHIKKRTDLRYQKIQYLHENPPKKIDKEEGISLVWPQELLFDKDKRFIGFLMTKIKGEKLELLTLPKIPRKYREQWSSYSFQEDRKLTKRLGLCFKIAKAIAHLHRSQKYIVVDMKPDNIMVNTRGEIALVDLDSIEVVKDGETIFDAPVATPEYTPPDSYKKWKVDPTQEDPWDRFGLAVILYKTLLGIHPFAASAGKPFERFTSVYQKIENGLYVHDPLHRSHFSMIPALHQSFDSLPPAIQDLFNRCFIEGYQNPFARPSSEEWKLALHAYHQHHSWQEEDVALPTIRLQHLPSSINLDQFYKLPIISPISPESILQVKKGVSAEELKNHHLPVAIQNPKEIRSQRFFNFIIFLIIIVLVAAFSLLFPLYIMGLLGVVAYLGFNYMTYRSRKSAGRKDAILSIFNTQMSYFDDLIKTTKGYEFKIYEFIDTMKKLQKKTPKEYLQDILMSKQLLLDKIKEFEAYLEKRKTVLRTIKREEKKEYNALLKYYSEQTDKQVLNKKIKGRFPLQKIILLKRAYRLGELEASDKETYQDDLEALLLLQTQFEIEQLGLDEKYLERSKDILFSINEAHKKIKEEIHIYHLSVKEKDASNIKYYFDQQKTSLSELDRLVYDLNKLEKPIEEQVMACRYAKRSAELYKKISYPRHVLEMAGILKPF